MRAFALVLVIFIASLAAGATSAARPLNQSAAREIHGLRSDIASHRSRTWHWQDVGGYSHTPTSYAERSTRSVAFLGWMNRRWNSRQKRAHHLALARPKIVYLALWTCIHNYEGSWNNADTGHNGHYGGLQMTSPWGKGAYYVLRADWLTPYEQMRKAELGFRASGYSLSWLQGQWNHPDCMYLGGGAHA